MRTDGFFSRTHLSGVQSLLIFRALQIGDMLCAVPAFRALRRALPEAQITLVGLPWAAAFAQRFFSLIDRFISFPGHPSLPEQSVDTDRYADFLRETRALQADLAIQMHGSGRFSNAIVAEFGARRRAGFAPEADCGDDFLPYSHQGSETDRLLALTRFLGADGTCSELDFPVTAEDQQDWQATGLVEHLGGKDYFCLHPGARDRSKCWSVDGFAQVADALAQSSGVRVVLTGSAAERDLTDAVAARITQPVINAALPWSLGAMAACMQRARLLICNDSGVSHIAAALRVPSVVIFTTTDMQRWAPANRQLHRCVWDPKNLQRLLVIQHAQDLLASDAPEVRCLP